MSAAVLPPTISVATLLREFKPIESIVDGLPIGRGMVTAITALTGHGKTTLATSLEVALATGRRFAGREVTHGSVLVLAGENPDDYTMHLIATMQDQGIQVEELGQLAIMAGRFSIDNGILELADRLDVVARELVAIIVDTSAAFFDGQDENDNVAMGRHARLLRELTQLPGRPAVIVLCHPTKGASSDNLLPRGGGAFLNEIDANLTLWKDAAGVVSLHHAGKVRGAHFEPVRFELTTVELAGYADCRGKPLWSSVTRHLGEDRAEQIQSRELNDQDRLLIALRKFAGESVSELAYQAGFVSETGAPQKSTVDRKLKALVGLKLAEQDRKGKWKLTPKGQKEAEALPC